MALTIREELQAKLNALTDEYNAAAAPIKAELDKTESWLEKEYDVFKAELEAVIAKVRGPVDPPST